MTTRRAEELEYKLERLMDYYLHGNRDHATYQVCEILQEIIDALPKEDEVEL